jgi:hypothetical protein
LPIVEIDDTFIRVDGASAGTIRSVEDVGRIQKVDRLYSLMKTQRETWKAAHPEKDFPGVAGLRVEPDLAALVLKSVFQTVAFAGYPRITLQLAGSLALYDLEADLPWVPGWSSEAQASDMDVVQLRMDDEHPDAVVVAWKHGKDVIKESSVAPQDLGKTICDDWKKQHLHHDASDPLLDDAIVHLANRAKAHDLVPMLEALSACQRERTGGTMGPVFATTFSVR